MIPHHPTENSKTEEINKTHSPLLRKYQVLASIADGQFLLQQSLEIWETIVIFLQELLKLQFYKIWALV